MSELSALHIMYLQGVGPKKADLLKTELKMVSFEDLIYYFPYKYIDRSRIYAIRELTGNMPYIQVKAKISTPQPVGDGRSKRLVAKASDGTGILELVWFKSNKYISDQIDPTAEYIIFGKPGVFNGTINVVHPELERLKADTPRIEIGLMPHYNTTEKMKSGFLNSKAIHKLQHTVFQAFKGKIPETLPAHFIHKHRLMLLDDALRNIHFPPDMVTLEKAQFRLKFEELFYIQLNILKLKNQRTFSVQGHLFPVVGHFFNTFYNEKLPFELTNAQKRVIKEIRRDMGSGRQMNRLLQGDVGSGKTLVALMVMLIACDNLFQACLMAPTEILATQHYQSITQLTAGMGINVALLTGSTKKRDREILSQQLLSGELHMLIGTHALIEEHVQFQNLGLVIIDEQHRFGVAQRARLWKKNIHPPHVLVMTATPIPRTLAMTMYGDLDVSVIDELPPGRKPIKTFHYFDSKRLPMFGFLRKQIEAGHQVYVVYPMIKESEKMDYKYLEDGYEAFARAFPPPEYVVTCVHGQMKNEEKDASMKLFAEGKSHILIATTVIEVGVDVPNANVMVIESAERFGLSQLHQLRGRVGRGAKQSYCLLMTSYKLSAEAKKRITTMVATNDGFEIAEADLKLRGPGDMEGTQQSGVPFDLKISNLA
ncbi:MAG: ATP-dependent DNA helicase RecG, partial [Marinilabiliaceae bacterium]|nr:ATP-dependent DNA helicase RecG [Marinilabiliaceae bacterium]